MHRSFHCRFSSRRDFRLTPLALACAALSVRPAWAQPLYEGTPSPAEPPAPPDATPTEDAAAAPAPAVPPEGPPPSSDAAAAEADEAELAAAIASDTSDAPPPAVAGGTQPASAQNPSISFIAAFAGAAFSDENNLQTGGHDPDQTGFNLQQLELAVSANVDPFFRFDSNVVFGLFEVEIEEAYATTLDLPLGLQARFGQFLSRFGRVNATHVHAWDFVDQPFAIGRVFGSEGNRGLGAELSWLTPLPWYVLLSGSVTNANGEVNARSFFGAEDLGVESPLDLLYVTVVEQFFPLSDDWSLAWGNSAAFGPNSTGRDNRTEVYGTDLYLKYRPITEASFTSIALTTEWMLRRRQVPSDVLSDVSGFAQITYRFDRQWAVGGRYELGTPATGDLPASFDPLDPEWTGDRHRAAANLTFWPSEFSRLRLQGSGDFPDWRDEPIWAAFLAAEVDVGPHGAHPF